MNKRMNAQMNEHMNEWMNEWQGGDKLGQLEEVGINEGTSGRELEQDE